MNVTETLNDGLKRGYQITVGATELDAKVTEKLEEARPDIEMKGFRKGKVPMALLKKQFGQRLLGEVMQESVDGALNSHLEESGDRPAVQPDIKVTNEDWKEGDDLVVDVAYEKLPDVPEADFSGIKIERLKVAAAEADVQEALDTLAGNTPNFKDRKKGSKAKDGDQVVIDFLGKVGGEPFEGGAAEDYPLVRGGRFRAIRHRTFTAARSDKNDVDWGDSCPRSTVFIPRPCTCSNFVAASLRVSPKRLSTPALLLKTDTFRSLRSA